MQVNLFSGANKLNKSGSSLGVILPNAGKKVLIDFGEYVSIKDLGNPNEIKGIVNREATYFLINEADYLFISHAHEDHVNGIFLLASFMGDAMRFPVLIATMDTISFIKKTCESKAINFDKVFANGFIPIKQGMDKDVVFKPRKMKKALKTWNSKEHSKPEDEEYQALYNGLTLDLGYEEKIHFFPVSHMLGSVGACFQSEDTKVVYTGDYTFDRQPFAGIPSNPKLLSSLAPVKAVINDIMWAQSPIQEEFSVEKTVHTYTPLFKEAENRRLIMAITPEYNEPLFAFIKASYLAGRKNIVFHMNENMKSIVKNLLNAIDTESKIGSELQIFFADETDTKNIPDAKRFDICDRPSPQNPSLAQMLENGDITNDAAVYLSQPANYPELTEKLQTREDINVRTLPPIKAHPTWESVQKMLALLEAEHHIAMHAPSADTRKLFANPTFSGNFETLPSYNGSTYTIGKTVNYFRSASRYLCFMRDNTAKIVDESALSAGKPALDNPLAEAYISSEERLKQR